MTNQDKIDKTVVKKVKISEAKNDFDFWCQQSYEFRLETLAKIREEYNRWKYTTLPGFQRVVRIIK